MRGATYARRKKGITRVSEASWRQPENAWFQDRPERQQGAIIFYPRTSLSFPNCSFQAIECNNETATITHVRRMQCRRVRSFFSWARRGRWNVRRKSEENSSITLLLQTNVLSRLVASRLERPKWSSESGSQLVWVWSLTLWACRSRAALKYKRATVTSRRCCCKLFPVTPVWLQGFSGISVDYGAVTRVACRNLFIFYFNVFILKIIRPARGFLPLPFGVRWGYLCSLKFCFLWISSTIRKILYQDAHWFILN